VCHSHLVVIDGVNADGKTLLRGYTQRRQKIEDLLFYHNVGRVERCVITAIKNCTVAYRWTAVMGTNYSKSSLTTITFSITL